MKIAGVTLKLAGIDAPELLQHCTESDGKYYPCGRLSLEFLNSLLVQGPVSCRIVMEVDGEKHAICLTGNQDIAEQVVAQGQAIAVGGFGYDAVEAQARSARRGLWAGTFVPPDQWRAMKAEHPPITEVTREVKQ